ncbi:MAG: SMP-30/gluconolactonase/LRE family protein [Rhizomicrobium sp.]
MRPYLRAALTAGAVLAAVAVGVAVRTLNVYGVFTDVTPAFAGQCTAIRGVVGPEDIAIDEKTRLAFVSALDRYAMAKGKPSPQDGIYVLPLDGPAHLTKLAGAPADFHPHGISLLRDAGGLVLQVISHHTDGTSGIEIFDVSAPSGGPVRLIHIGDVESRELSSPNAIAAVDRERFYVVNDHGSTTAFGRWLEDLLVLPRANLLYFDGMVFRVVAQHLAYPAGLALSPDGRYLYATEINARRIDTFARQPVSGSLDQAGTLDIPSGVDNLRFDAKGQLWVGSHPKNIAMNAFRSDPSRPAPSEIFKVTLANDIPQSAQVVYSDMGTQIGGSSVAAVSGTRMLIGSPLDNHVLDCVMGR